MVLKNKCTITCDCIELYFMIKHHLSMALWIFLNPVLIFFLNSGTVHVHQGPFPPGHALHNLRAQHINHLSNQSILDLSQGSQAIKGNFFNISVRYKKLGYSSVQVFLYRYLPVKLGYYYIIS